jgi:hypothetical protein
VNAPVKSLGTYIPLELIHPLITVHSSGIAPVRGRDLVAYFFLTEPEQSSGHVHSKELESVLYTTTCTVILPLPNRTNNVVHTAAEEVVGVAVADRTMNQVGYRRNIHFHLRNLPLGIHHHLCMPR